MSGYPDRRLRVLLVGTEFFRGHGGIQNINRLLVRAFCRMGIRTPLALDVFSFTDGPEHIPATFPSVQGGEQQAELHWHAARRSRAALSWQLGRRVAAERPDLVLFTHVALLPLGRLVRSLAPGVRLAALAHGTEVWGPLARRVTGVLSLVDAFVSPSEYTARKLAEVHCVSSARIQVLPHGLDPNWAAECGATVGSKTTSLEGRILLSVTRLSRADTAGKGVELVLHALPAVLARFPDARYVIAGGGGDLRRLQESVGRLGLESCVQFLGSCGPDALARAYSSADVFVLPTQVEGFGVVFLEAMFHRLPVVAVRASATPEVVEDAETGMLIPPGDSRELSAALAALLSDEDRRRALGEAGRRRVERMYTFDHFAARWERWIAGQVPEAIYAARQGGCFSLARAAAGAA